MTEPDKTTDRPAMIPCGSCAGTGKTYPQFDTMEELLEFVLAQPAGEWGPGWYYNEAGDQIEAYWKNQASNSDGSLMQAGIILHRAARGENEGEVIGVTITGILARLTINATRAKYTRPHPVEPVTCPVCNAEQTGPGGSKMIYAANPVKCQKCAVKFDPKTKAVVNAD